MSGRYVTRPVLVLSAIVAALYLLVYPVLVDRGTVPADAVGEGLAVFVFAALWLVVAEYGYVAAAELNGWKRRSLVLPVLARTVGSAADVPHATRGSTAVKALTSYLLSVYGFAVAYFFLSLRDPRMFSQPLGLVDAVYFSVVTAATVGYGDIVPTAALSRLLVTVEIVIGFAYAVFIFSTLASRLRSSGAAP